MPAKVWCATNRGRGLDSIIACVGVVALLLAGCGSPRGGVSPSCPQHHAATTVSSPSAGGALVPKRVHMLGICSGWGLTADAVLKTTDGGINWRKVGPSSVAPGHLSSAGAVFLDAQHAWIPVAATSANLEPVAVDYTDDGGRSWRATKLNATVGNASDGVYLAFADTEHGWAAVDEGTPGHPAFELFYTVDGGIRWTEHDLVFGRFTGMAWVSPADGWLVGYLNPLTAQLYTSPNGALPSSPSLYGSTDGGSTWAPANLAIGPSLAPSGGHGTLSLLPPTFAEYTALLPACLSGSSSSRMQFFVSANGGRTWSGTTPLPLDIGGDCRNWGFVWPNHLWVAGAHALHVSLDGGRTWSSIATGLTLAPADEVDFVTASVGWVVTANNILRTSDGGTHWVRVGR